MLSLLGWASARARSCQQNVLVVRMWRQLHGGPASGGGIERVFFSSGKQHDALKKRTMDKTLESTMKASVNTKLPTCDDKGVFTDDDDDTYRKRK